MNKEKRVGKSYKITQSAYDRAMKACKKNKTTLAQQIELFVCRMGAKKPTKSQIEKSQKMIADLREKYSSQNYGVVMGAFNPKTES